MRTRLQARLLQRTSILSLPIELLSLVLDNLRDDNTPSETSYTYCCCSLVCRGWNELSLQRLWCHLEIQSASGASKLADSSALGRYETRRLTVNDVSDWKETELVISRLSGLMKLLIIGGSNFPFHFFSYPALSGITSLTLDRGVGFEFTRTPPPSVTFRLHKLVYSAANSSTALMVVNEIIQSSLGRGSSSLHSLELSHSFGAFAPVAASLRSLVVYDFIMDSTAVINESYRLYKILLFLPYATSLSHFGIRDLIDFDRTTPSCLPPIFAAIPSRLDSLALPFKADGMMPDILRVLVESLESLESLMNLKTIWLAESRLDDLELVKGWDDFSVALDKKGIRLVTASG